MEIGRIPFNRPTLVGNELEYLQRAARGEAAPGGTTFTAAARDLLLEASGAAEVLLTTSCTSALELSALLLDIRPGDVVIVPSFTFVTTALAFARAGARLRFADIETDTLGIDPASVAALMDDRVRAVVPVHYGGVACDLVGLREVLAGSDVSVIADNAHGLFGTFENRPISTHARFTALSFHHTKSFTCGEGGALVVNDPADVARARVLFDKGTNRQEFLAGEVDHYSWVDTGSSFALAEMLAAHLLGQLEQRDSVLARREHIAQRYDDLLRPHADELGLGMMTIPPGRTVARHLFYVLLDDVDQREEVRLHLRRLGIDATSHYVPLHDSPGAKNVTDRFSDCPVTSQVSDRILRLPFHNDLTDDEIDHVCDALLAYLRQ